MIAQLVASPIRTARMTWTSIWLSKWTRRNRLFTRDSKKINKCSTWNSVTARFQSRRSGCKIKLGKKIPAAKASCSLRVNRNMQLWTRKSIRWRTSRRWRSLSISMLANHGPLTICRTSKKELKNSRGNELGWRLTTPWLGRHWPTNQ